MAVQFLIIKLFLFFFCKVWVIVIYGLLDFDDCYWNLEAFVCGKKLCRSAFEELMGKYLYRWRCQLIKWKRMPTYVWRVEMRFWVVSCMCGYLCHFRRVTFSGNWPPCGLYTVKNCILHVFRLGALIVSPSNWSHSVDLELHLTAKSLVHFSYLWYIFGVVLV